jgi:hypothetical protein
VTKSKFELRINRLPLLRLDFDRDMHTAPGLSLERPRRARRDYQSAGPEQPGPQRRAVQAAPARRRRPHAALPGGSAAAAGRGVPV